MVNRGLNRDSVTGALDSDISEFVYQKVQDGRVLAATKTETYFSPKM